MSRHIPAFAGAAVFLMTTGYPLHAQQPGAAQQAPGAPGAAASQSPTPNRAGTGGAAGPGMQGIQGAQPGLNGFATAPTTVPGSTPPPRTLTMEEAVATALRNSNSLRLASEGVERARGRVQEQRAGFLPTVGVTANITRLDEGQSINFPDPNGQPQNIDIVRQDQRDIAVRAQIPIDFTGLIRAAVQQAQFSEIAARLDFNRGRNQIVLDTKNAYYEVLRAKAFVAVADQSLANARERERISDVQLRAGTGTRFDVLRAQTEVANAQQALIAARNRVNLATAALANAMNVDQNTPLDVTEARENPEQTDNYNTAIAEAYRTRPEILQAEANTEAARKGIILAQRSLFPTVGVGANYNVTPDAGGFAPKTRSWAAVATISVPIFEGGTARARERQARADVQSAETNKQIVQDNVALGVRQAYLGLLEAQERVDVANAALTQAQEQYRLAQVRFREGVTAIPGGSPLLEVSDAQQALTQAQTNQVNARYDLENARARLDAAIGRYAFGGISPGYQSPAAVPENIRR